MSYLLEKHTCRKKLPEEDGQAMDLSKVFSNHSNVEKPFKQVVGNRDWCIRQEHQGISYERIKVNKILCNQFYFHINKNSLYMAYKVNFGTGSISAKFNRYGPMKR